MPDATGANGLLPGRGPGRGPRRSLGRGAPGRGPPWPEPPWPEPWPGTGPRGGRPWAGHRAALRRRRRAGRRGAGGHRRNRGTRHRASRARGPRTGPLSLAGRRAGRRRGRGAGRRRGRRLRGSASRRAGGRRRGLLPGRPRPGRGTAAIAVCCLAGLSRRRLRLWPPTLRLRRLAAELIFKSANYGRLDCRGRRTDELAHFLELGHHGLALYPELLREFVYPDLRHCAPSVGPTPPGHRGRSGAARAPDGLSFGFSSPRSHRALITTDPAFPALLPFFRPTCPAR